MKATNGSQMSTSHCGEKLRNSFGVAACVISGSVSTTITNRRTKRVFSNVVPPPLSAWFCLMSVFIEISIMLGIENIQQLKNG